MNRLWHSNNFWKIYGNLRHESMISIYDRKTYDLPTKNVVWDITYSDKGFRLCLPEIKQHSPLQQPTQLRKVPLTGERIKISLIEGSVVWPKNQELKELTN